MAIGLEGGADAAIWGAMPAIALLTLLHLYVGWRIAPLLPGPGASWPFSLLLLASLLLIPAAFLGRRAASRASADRWTWVGGRTEATMTGLVVDNYFFGVAAVSTEGNESPVAFPIPGR